MRSLHPHLTAVQASWKKNWHFSLSAFCFLCLCLNASQVPALALQLFCTLVAAAATGCMTAALPAGCFELLKKAGWRNWLLSGLSALGICQSAYSIFYGIYIPSGIVGAIAGRMSIDMLPL